MRLPLLVTNQMHHQIKLAFVLTKQIQTTYTLIKDPILLDGFILSKRYISPSLNTHILYSLHVSSNSFLLIIGTLRTFILVKKKDCCSSGPIVRKLPKIIQKVLELNCM